MEELNKGYEFTKAQIAELESLRAWKAEIEKQEPVASVQQHINGVPSIAWSHRRIAHLPNNTRLYAAPVVSPDVEKLKAENQSLKNEAAFWKQETKTWADKHDELAESFQCHPNKPVIERLKTELEAARKNAEWISADDRLPEVEIGGEMHCFLLLNLKHRDCQIVVDAYYVNKPKDTAWDNEIDAPDWALQTEDGDFLHLVGWANLTYHPDYMGYYTQFETTYREIVAWKPVIYPAPPAIEQAKGEV